MATRLDPHDSEIQQNMSSTIIVSLVAALIAWLVYKAIYNLYFHPLAKIPGPWWASISYLAEIYYDLIAGGLYFKQIVGMHEQYGPLVRINPNELHCDDPFFYERLYGTSGQKRKKDVAHAEISGVPTSVIATIDHDLHRQRRGYMANFFSKQSIARLEPYIQSKVNQLTSKLRDAHHNGDTVVGVQAFGALTGDIIAYCVYGESLEDLDRPGFSSPLVAAVDAILITAHFRRFFPLVNNMIRKLPNWIVERVSPPAKTLLSFEHWIINMSIKTLDQQGTAKKPSVGTKTIFDLLTSPEIAPEEKSLKRLQDEGHMILIAGLVTTTRYLTNMVCWLVTYPEILKKLRRELATLSGDMDEKPTWTQLEGLPYLTAFINESLRCHSFMTDRFPRVPVESLQYGDFMIPADTPVGAMPWLLNHHPTIFPDPETFRPERWLEAEARGEHLTRYLVSFTKGTRMCLGIHLAYIELYLTVHALVTNFDFELVDSGVENIIPKRDFALGVDEGYGFGVKFLVTRLVK